MRIKNILKQSFLFLGTNLAPDAVMQLSAEDFSDPHVVDSISFLESSGVVIIVPEEQLVDAALEPLKRKGKVKLDE